MSRYEWESGEIILPAKAAYPFKKQLTEYHNNQIDRMFTIAQAAYANVRAKFKGHRNVEFRDEIDKQISALLRRSFRVDCANQLHDEYFSDLDALFFKSDPARKKPVKPTRTRFTQKTVLSKPFSYLGHDGDFAIQIRERILLWRAGENNRAVEYAREHPMAVKMFELLRKVKWTRGSGGKIIGNDEYNRESECEGGGANYVTESFGP